MTVLDKNAITRALYMCGALEFEVDDNIVTIKTVQPSGLLLKKAPELVENGQLLIDFGNRFNGNFDCRNCYLTTLKGCPESITGNFTCTNNNLTTLEFAPSIIHGELYANLNQNLTSLVGISDYIQEMGTFLFSDRKIKEGGLGLLQIKGLMQISNVTAPFQIIQKYLGTDNIIECQSELIEAGFEEYAVL